MNGGSESSVSFLRKCRNVPKARRSRFYAEICEYANCFITYPKVWRSKTAWTKASRPRNRGLGHKDAFVLVVIGKSSKVFCRIGAMSPAVYTQLATNLRPATHGIAEVSYHETSNENAWDRASRFECSY